ncbi:hypothetical protein NliqN6_0500, partial [Naganishia liquefaciens]
MPDLKCNRCQRPLENAKQQRRHDAKCKLVPGTPSLTGIGFRSASQTLASLPPNAVVTKKTATCSLFGESADSVAENVSTQRKRPLKESYSSDGFEILGQ